MVNMQHDWCRADLPTSTYMNWSISVCLVKQAYEHDKILASLERYMHEINPIFTEAWLEAKEDDFATCLLL